MMLLQRAPSDVLDEFLELYGTVYSFDEEKARRLIKGAIYHYKTEASDDSYQGQLETRWYESLKNDSLFNPKPHEVSHPAYDVYDDEYYFTDLWVCWHQYSRGYLRALEKSNPADLSTTIFDLLEDVKSVVDLGCGISYTTAALTELFPSARVYGTNLEDTRQYKFGQLLSEKYGFDLVSSPADIEGGAELVFASEYFEHIHFVIEHLEHVLTHLEPRFLYIANAFNTRALGHFEWYQYSNNPLLMTHQSKISGEFNQTLRNHGYKMMTTKNWNQRPMLWSRND